MKKNLSPHVACLAILMVFLIFIGTADSAPAPVTPVKIKLTDGTLINARIIGDEFFNVVETLDGYTIVRDDSNDWAFAKKGKDGKLRPTKHKVGKADPNANGLKKHERPDAAVIDAQINARKKSQPKPIVRGKPDKFGLAPADGINDGPSGAPPAQPSALTSSKILVILVDFAAGSHIEKIGTWSDFNTLVFSVGTVSTGSVKDFWSEVSYGQFNMTGQLIDWTMAPETYSYYCGSSQGMGSYPNNSQKLCLDICQAVDSVVDFSQYDQNNDGYVDGVCMIFEGDADGSATKFWPHKWSTNQYAIQLDGKWIYRYCINDEQKSGGGSLCEIGTICHELGHVFGAPDLYDYDSGTYNVTDNDENPVRYWCLMAAGNWTGATSGETPSHPSAFIKARYYGWLTPTVISTSGNYSMPAFQTASAGQRAYKIPMDSDGDEYMLVANRGQSVSTFDHYAGWGYARESGILATHIDWHSDAGSNNVSGTVNNKGAPTFSYYGVWVEDPGRPANIGVFPYEMKFDAAMSSNVGRTTLMPGSNVYARTNTNHEDFAPFRIYNVSARATTMTFDLEYLNISTSMADGTFGVAYSQVLGISGNTTQVFSSQTGGTLPPGLSLDGGTNTISGTPTSGGTFTFEIRAFSTLNLVNYENVSITIASGAPTEPDTLLTNGMSNPTSLGCSSVSFTSIFRGSGSTANEAYVQVDDNADFSSPVWDSGFNSITSTASDARCPAISYGGSALSIGVQYYWRIKFKNTSAVESPWSTESASFQIAQYSQALTFRGTHMLNVPCFTGTKTITELFGDDISTPIYVWKYDESTRNWIQLGAGDGLQNNTGYMIWSETTRTDIGMDGDAVSDPASVVIPLTCSNENDLDLYGWNLVRNPYSVSVNWSSCILQNCQETIWYPWNGTEYLYWNRAIPAGTGSDVIPAGATFWVSANGSNAQLTIPKPGGAPAPLQQPALSWLGKINVYTGSLRDTQTIFGAHELASYQNDQFDTLKIDSFSYQYIEAYFDHTDWGRYSAPYAVDIKPFPAIGEVLEWNLVIHATDSYQKVTMNWEIPKELYPDWNFYFADDSRGVVMDMKQCSAYEYPASGAHTKAVRIFSSRTAEFLLGDVDSSGVIDTEDAGMCARYEQGISALSDTQKFSGDLNDDGEVNIFDALLIQKRMK